MTREESTDDTRSLVALLRELPGILMELLRAEFEQFKREMARKSKNFGVGSLLFAIAGGMAFFLLGTLTTAGILALALVMPGWAAALVVSGVLLVLVVILVAVGVALFKKSAGLVPTETMDSIVQDAHALKGEGRFDS
jgi:O-antigen ligase